MKPSIILIRKQREERKQTHYRVPIAILLGLSINAIAARHLQGAINTRTALNQRLPFLRNKKADTAEHCP
jgi:hypothetical protein